MTKPNKVFEAMEVAVSDCFKEHFDRGVAPEIDAIIKAALGAARELGWKLVPREVDDNMLAAMRGDDIDGSIVVYSADWTAPYDAAPDLTESGGE